VEVDPDRVDVDRNYGSRTRAEAEIKSANQIQLSTD
jgi:predicted metallopeptidase